MTATALPATPYKGLASFEGSELDALLFFGREREAEIAVANLVAARLTVLYGPSGVGKTSLLQAAVGRGLRALPERPAVVIHAAWADDPAAALAASIAGEAGVEPAPSLLETVEAAVLNRGELFLILDQLEEYFLYHAGERGPWTLAEALPELIARKELPVHVLLGIREDALAQLDAFKARIPGLFSNSLRLDHLRRDAARRAIVGPIERFAELAGEEGAVGIEPELVEAVLDGVEAGKVAHGAGGRGVVKARGRASSVEAPYLQLVMQRLWEVERTEGSRTLRLATLERLGGPARIVEDHLRRALALLTPEQQEIASAVFNHLVTPSGTKIAHDKADLAGYAGSSPEALAPVLATLSSERILRPAGRNGGDGGAYEIYHDVLADAVLAWRIGHRSEVALATEREVARRKHRRLLLLSGSSLLALLAVIAVAVFALSERSDARSQARSSKARELDASALALLATDPERSVQLAADSARMWPNPTAEETLRQAIMADRLKAALPSGGPITSLAYSRDGRLLLAASQDGKARVYDARTHALLRTLASDGPVLAAAFDPQGSRIVTASADHTARVWDARSGRELLVLHHSGPVVDASFTRAGQIVTASRHGARLWNAAGRPVRLFRQPVPVLAARSSPDGELLATRGTDRRVRVFAVSNGRLLHALDAGSTPGALAFAADGRLAAGGADGSVLIWEPGSGRLLVRMVGDQGPVASVVFSRSGRELLTASLYGARLWNAANGDTVGLFTGGTGYYESAVFGVDDTVVLTTSDDRTARTWSGLGSRLIAILAPHGDKVRWGAFRPDGAEAATGSDDGVTRIWDPGTAPDLQPSSGSPPTPPATSARSADGTTATVSGRTVLLSGPGGKRVLRGHLDAVNSVAFSPDGEQLVTASRDHDARVWSLSPRVSVRVLRAHFGSVADARFSPDGRWIVTAGPTTVGLWEASTGQFVGYLRGPTSLLTAVTFLPDSRTIVTREQNGTVRRYVCRVCGTIPELLDLAKQRLEAMGPVPAASGS
jgi:WD40 repeat protein